VRYAISEVHGAVNRIHNPSAIGVRVALNALFSDQRRFRERREQGALDQFLGPNIHFQFDIVLGYQADAF
jgi:hypothetical protein